MARFAQFANFYAESDMNIKSSDREDYQHIARPVGALAKEFPRGHISSRHRHVRAQLLYAVAGVLEVTTECGLWIIPPQRAVWIPPLAEHEVRFRTAASVRTLYVHPAAIPAQAPASPCAIGVSALLRELILRATALPLDYDDCGKDGRIIALALEEITWQPQAQLYLPVLRDARLAQIGRALLDDPADARTLEQWAAAAHTSARTLARLFQAELGSSFLHWRQQIRVLAALPRLAAGEAVTAIALDLGYETPGAFSAMFRRLMGVMPSRYFPTAQCD